MIRTLAIIAILAAPASAAANALEVQPVTDGIWALVGEKEQRSPENLGNNATFGVIETPDGVVLVDPGGSWKGAEAIHAEIRKLSDKPVKFVVNTGGQDHRWLGNGYWKEQGATIIASAAAVEDQKARGSQQMSGLAQFLGADLEGTEPVHADITFEADHVIELGGTRLEIRHRGQAHTPGDSFVWLADKRVMFTGDIVYVERILGNGSQSNAKSWIEVFEAMAAFNPTYVVPGHGHAATLEKAEADTHAYLVNLRTKVGELIRNGGVILDAPKIDQSAFAYLEQFESLAGRNAQTTFEQMEWE